MHRLALLVAVCIAAMLPAASAEAQSQSFVQIEVGGLNRRYLLYLPKGFDPSENLPVMMWFHGGGGNASGGIGEADFRSLASSQRFILVYAEAWPDALESCRCWGYDSGEGEANGNYEIDLAYASAVVDDLVENQNADRDRIYAGGYSMGASFVWDLACAKSDEFAAIAPVAASMYIWTYDNCSAGLPTAVCHILGTNDFYAPYNGASWVPSVADQNAFWVDKNQSETEPETVSLGGGVTRYTWAASEGCHGFQHFRRQGGGHDVPSFGPSAIWDFVSQYDLDGEIECGPDQIPGDLNGDGVVNAADLGLLIAAWSTPNADINGDGTTNSADLGLLIANWS